MPGITLVTKTPTPKPEPPPTPLAPTQYFSTNPLLKEWVTRARYAASVIISNIVDPIGLGVKENKSVDHIWQQLCKNFDQSSEQLTAIHKKKLWNRKMAEGSDFEEHVKVMRTLIKQACKVGAVISDS